MNRLRFILLLGVVTAAGPAPTLGAQTAKSGGEEFFIISSVDQTKHQIVFKKPTEVTTLMAVTDRTSIRDEHAKALNLSDLRAGDTVWVIATRPDRDGKRTALRIRKGPMTVEALHRLYLDFPAK